MMRVLLLWKRRCADVRAGTQAPPLRFRLDGLCMGRLMAFGLITCKWLFCLGRLRVDGWFRLGNGLCMAYAFRLGACVQMPLIRVGERLWGESSL